MEEIHRRTAECDLATNDRHASGVLMILNGLLVFTYQMQQYAAVAKSAEAARDKISELRKNLAHLAWELAFRERHIGKLFSHGDLSSRSKSITYGHPT